MTKAGISYILCISKEDNVFFKTQKLSPVLLKCF